MTAARPPGAAAGTETLQVFVLPYTRADAAALQKLLLANQLPHVLVANVRELLAASDIGVVLIAEETLLANLDSLRELVRNQPVWSDLPLIVLARAGHESVALNQIVPDLGNVSLVERPVRPSTLVSLLRSALRARTRQLQVRQHLAAQENAQHTIHEAERRYRMLVENISDYAIFTIDLEGRVTSWNIGAERLLGYVAAEILGKHARLLFDAVGGADEFEAEISQARAAGRAMGFGWRIRKNAERIFVESLLMAVRDDDGALLGYAKFMRDVTARHRVEMEREQLLESERAARSDAERSSRLKEEFLATLSHELRTPLNAILGWSKVLQKASSPSPEISQGLQVIERNARAQARIIEDLLDMSSIISGKVRLEEQRVELTPVIEAAVGTIHPAIQAKNIELRIAMDPTATLVRGDPNRLQQIFWNLLTNAAKFTARDGQISIRLRRINAGVEISVADSGEGIEPAFLPYVFDRFRQADSSKARRHGGLGLGLSIVKQLVELHGGAISAHSEGPGHGATFRVVLPLLAGTPEELSTPAPSGLEAADAAMEASPEGGDTVTVQAMNLTGVRILAVDDEVDAQALLMRLLGEFGAKVTTAGSAAQAMNQIALETPDVLVSDIGMPGEDGYALIRRIRALTNGKSQIAAIALSAYARDEDRARSLQAGYQAHLSKPVNPNELVTTIAAVAGLTPGAPTCAA